MLLNLAEHWNCTTIQEALNDAVDKGFAEEDLSALFKVIEEQVGVKARYAGTIQSDRTHTVDSGQLSKRPANVWSSSAASDPIKS